jgi:hypothetical protein
MTTGNHDFDRCTKKEYERLFFPLLCPDQRDPASLSYTKQAGRFLFLCMDDHVKSIEGKFLPETMQWLEERLRETREQDLIPVFLSHHSVLYDPWTGSSRFYQIQNPELLPLLEQYRVPLAFSGHQHFPDARREKNLTEIVLPAPFGGEYTFGFLQAEEDRLIYETKKLDFSRYASEETALLAKKRKHLSGRYLNESILGKGTDPAEDQQLMVFLSRWMYLMYTGKLGSCQEEIRNHPLYAKLLARIRSTAYEDWIRCRTEGNTLSADRLVIPFSPSSCKI